MQDGEKPEKDIKYTHLGEIYDEIHHSSSHVELLSAHCTGINRDNKS